MRSLPALLLLLLALTGCVTPDAADSPGWRLAPASEVAGPRHLIVIVPLDARPALLRVARDLELEHALDLDAEWPLESIAVHCLVFRVPATTTVEAAMEGLAADPRVRSVQTVQQFRTLARTYPDELFALQTGLQALRIPQVHAVTTGGGVRLGLIDTRPDCRHPDLAGRIALVQDFVQAPDDPGGPEDHGTAMAGIIAADDGNGRGMVGVAPGVELLALRGCWQEDDRGPGRCSSFSLARALNFALLNEVDVLNLSLGGPHDPLLAELIAAAVDRGVTVVAAETGHPDTGFPASEPGVIAVSDRPVPLGRAGLPAMPVPAPGTDILSTAPNAGYDFFSGSSVASAHVAGVAALLLAVDPSLSPSALRETLVAAARASADAPLVASLDACTAVSRVIAAPERLACE